MIIDHHIVIAPPHFWSLILFLSISIDHCNRLIQSCLSPLSTAVGGGAGGGVGVALAGNRRQSHGNSQHSAVLSFTPPI